MKYFLVLTISILLSFAFLSCKKTNAEDLSPVENDTVLGNGYWKALYWGDIAEKVIHPVPDSTFKFGVDAMVPVPEMSYTLKFTFDPQIKGTGTCDMQTVHFNYAIPFTITNLNEIKFGEPKETVVSEFVWDGWQDAFPGLILAKASTYSINSEGNLTIGKDPDTFVFEKKK